MARRSIDVDDHVGMRIRERRRELGMSQTDLGDALGISFQQVQKYEIGTNRVAASRLLGVARMRDVDIEYFFEGIKRAGRASARKRGKTSATTTRRTRRRTNR